MALPININQLINGRTVESAHIEYQGDWNPEPIIPCGRHASYGRSGRNGKAAECRQEFLVNQAERKEAPETKKRRSKREIRELALSVLRENGNMSRSELIKEMGYAKENSTLSDVIGGLIKEDIIEYLYPDNKHNVNQKLKLSKKSSKKR